MSRWNELKYTLGLNILFPRLCLIVLMPCGLLLAVSPPAESSLLQPNDAKVVLASCLLLFGLNVAANLSISRYLRRHQPQASPYVYKAAWDIGKRSGYFRIQVTDNKAFNRRLNEISRDQPQEAIRYWLWLDNVLILSAGAVVMLVPLAFLLMAWPVKLLWDKLTGWKSRPAAQG